MIRIDVVSDTVCPWCYVGKRRLDAALQQWGKPVEVSYHPYSINPDMPVEGRDRDTHYKKKFVDLDKLKKMTELLRQEGEGVGITFNFDALTHVPNTLNSHRLIRWAASAGVQEQVKEAIMKAYFEDAKDIGDTRILTAIAADNGMDKTIVEDLLKTNRDNDAIQAEITHANRIGINGVPTFIFNTKCALTGAQPADVILKALDQAAAST